jgi:hypothetical protein
MNETDKKAAENTTGEKWLLAIFEKEPKDSYRPNGLPPIDESLHTPEVIATLQKSALELE